MLTILKIVVPEALSKQSIRELLFITFKSHIFSPANSTCIADKGKWVPSITKSLDQYCRCLKVWIMSRYLQARNSWFLFYLHCFLCVFFRNNKVGRSSNSAEEIQWAQFPILYFSAEHKSRGSGFEPSGSWYCYNFWQWLESSPGNLRFIVLLCCFKSLVIKKAFCE